MGYLRTGWSSELLTLELSRQGGVNVHATTIQRWLARLYNDGIHDSLIVRGWLARHPRIKRLFQPVYHPWVNHIERLWKQLHDTVTPNHRCKDLDTLMNAVRRFMQVCQPFPGRHPALATAA